MISFMLQNITYLSVLIAALIGWGICILFHVLFPCHHEYNSCCHSMSGGMGGQQQQNKYGCQDHCHGEGIVHMLISKVGKLGILFVQAYGLAYILERLTVLSEYTDAILAALFVAVAFIVSSIFYAVLHQHKTVRMFVLKSLNILAIYAAMAAYFVYMS